MTPAITHDVASPPRAGSGPEGAKPVAGWL